jgi:transcriptional regulator GlxA family with amidase domain
MKRRDVLRMSVATAALAATAGVCAAADSARPLRPPTKGKIPVAFLISEGVQVIDLTGPWEVFQDTQLPDRGTTIDHTSPFDLFTIAETTNRLRATGGLQITPDYDFSTAPQPKLIVVPAQSSPTETTKAWLRKTSERTDITMSVCTGAFVLAKAGLLSGKIATTHHDFYDKFAAAFPDVDLRRGARFVEDGNISTAGGLTSGIDLALHVVERYFGRAVAQQTASLMEYESRKWIDWMGVSRITLNPDSAPIFRCRSASRGTSPVDA